MKTPTFVNPDRGMILTRFLLGLAFIFAGSFIFVGLLKALAVTLIAVGILVLIAFIQA